MVHSSVCRAPAAIAIIVFVGCCIVGVGGRRLVVAGAVVAIVFTVAVAGVILATVFVELVVLMGVWSHSRDCLHRCRCRCCIRNRPRGSCRPHGSRGSLSQELSLLRSSLPSLLRESSSQSSLWKLSSLRKLSSSGLHCRRCRCHLRNCPRRSRRPHRSRRHRRDHGLWRT